MTKINIPYPMKCLQLVAILVVSPVYPHIWTHQTASNARVHVCIFRLPLEDELKAMEAPEGLGDDGGDKVAYNI